MSDIDWNDPSLNYRAIKIPPSRFEPKVDELVSRIVGKKIFQQDPRLFKLVVKWKKGKSPNSSEPDNFLQNPKFIEELKAVLQ